MAGGSPSKGMSRLNIRERQRGEGSTRCGGPFTEEIMREPSSMHFCPPAWLATMGREIRNCTSASS